MRHFAALWSEFHENFGCSSNYQILLDIPIYYVMIIVLTFKILMSINWRDISRLVQFILQFILFDSSSLFVLFGWWCGSWHIHRNLCCLEVSTFFSLQQKSHTVNSRHAVSSYSAASYVSPLTRLIRSDVWRPDGGSVGAQFSAIAGCRQRESHGEGNEILQSWTFDIRQITTFLRKWSFFFISSASHLSSVAICRSSSDYLD